jgi:hypothetical protein
MNTRSYLFPRPKALQHDGPMIFASGFLATLAMTTIMYVLPMVGLGQVDLVTWTARIFGAVDLPTWAARLSADDPREVAALGITVHLFLAFGYAWLFADQVEPRLRLRPGCTGLLFGLALWLFAQAVAVPLLGALAGAQPSPGFLAIRLGPGAALASLVAHLTYGSTLGWVYGGRCSGGCGRMGQV